VVLGTLAVLVQIAGAISALNPGQAEEVVAENVLAFRNPALDVARKVLVPPKVIPDKRLFLFRLVVALVAVDLTFLRNGWVITIRGRVTTVFAFFLADAEPASASWPSLRFSFLGCSPMVENVRLIADLIRLSFLKQPQQFDCRQ